jgi:hypothetical protein
MIAAIKSTLNYYNLLDIQIGLTLSPDLCSTIKKRISQSSYLGACSQIFTIWFYISILLWLCLEEGVKFLEAQ